MSVRPSDAPSRVSSPLIIPHRSRTGRPLRVALVVEAAGGGVAVHVRDLIEGLADHGVEVHLIAPAGSRFDDSILAPPVLGRCASCVRVPMRRAVSWRDLSAYAHVFRHLLRIAPDVVHSHSSKAGVLARACFGPWRQVYTPHAFYTLNPSLGAAARGFYARVERWFGTLRTDTIIAVSRDESSHAGTALGLPPRKVVTIHNGVPAVDHIPRDAARQTLGVGQASFVVGFVGRFSHQKGVDRLMRVADLLASHGGTRVEFAVVGTGDFAAAANRAPDTLPPNVRVAGAIADARRYFTAFDVFALPSRYEGFPYVYLEAISAQVPIVTTAVAGATVIADERLGAVVPNADDMFPFADAIRALLDDPLERTNVAARCRRTIERFSAAQMVRRTLDVYLDVSPSAQDEKLP